MATNGDAEAPNGILTPKRSTNNTFSSFDWRHLCFVKKVYVMPLQIRGHFERFFHFSPRWILETFNSWSMPPLRKRRWENTQEVTLCSTHSCNTKFCQVWRNAIKMLIYVPFEIGFDSLILSRMSNIVVVYIQGVSILNLNFHAMKNNFPLKTPCISLNVPYFCLKMRLHLFSHARLIFVT